MATANAADASTTEAGCDVPGCCAPEVEAKPDADAKAKALMSAVVDGKTELAAALLGDAANPNDALTDDGLTPLMSAVINCNAKLAALLLRHDANPNQAKVSDGTTPLMFAPTSPGTELATLLLDHAADPNQAATDDGTTALLVATEYCRTAVAELLLRRGADPAQARKDGFTPLMAAAEIGEPTIATLLLDHGADPNQTSATPGHGYRHGITALMHATRQGEIDVVQVLLDRKADPNLTNANGVAALHISARDCDVTITRMLLIAGAYPDHAQSCCGCTALMCGAELGHLPIVQLLAVYGADRETRTKHDETAQDLAALGHMDGQQHTAAWLVIVAGWPAFKIATACRLHPDLRHMLRAGTIDPLGCTFAELRSVASAAAGTLWEDSPPPCPATTTLFEAAVSGWAPDRHFLFHAGVRSSVHAVLLVAERLQRRFEIPGDLFLPIELWREICGFFLRSHWDVPQEGTAPLRCLPSSVPDAMQV